MLDSFFSDRELVEFAKNIGRKLPFSVSSLQKDRCNGCLGGIPHRKIGGKAIYVPREVFHFLDNLVVIRFCWVASKTRQGTSTKRERVEAAARGVTVRELRTNGGCNAPK